MGARKLIAGALVLAALAAPAVIYRPDRAIRVATASVAHNVCSKTFVSGLDPQTVFAETTERDGIRRLRFGLSYHLDRHWANRRSFVGWECSAATPYFMRDSAACFNKGAAQPYLLRADIAALKAPKKPPLLPEIAGAAVVEPSDPKLKAALDHAFEEPAAPPFRKTKAVVVVHEGTVIAERYADGIGVDTPLLGFSLTKSVINALIGILTQQGGTSPSLPAPVPEWRGADRSAPRDRGRASAAHDDRVSRWTRPIAASIPRARWSTCRTTWPVSPRRPR